MRILVGYIKKKIKFEISLSENIQKLQLLALQQIKKPSIKIYPIKYVFMSTILELQHIVTLFYIQI